MWVKVFKANSKLAWDRWEAKIWDLASKKNSFASENTYVGHEIVGPRENITRYAMLGIRFWNSRSDSTSFSNWCVLDENFPERCGRMGKTHRFD